MTRFFVLIALAIVISCDARPEADVIDYVHIGVHEIDAELHEAINRYYWAEARGDWRPTYECRLPEYRQLVPYDVYVAEMNKGSSGWRLVSVEVLEVVHSDPAAVVFRMRFSEQVDQEVADSRFAGRITPGTVVRTVESTIWEMRNEAWYCVRPGPRARYPLNDRLVDQ